MKGVEGKKIIDLLDEVINHKEKAIWEESSNSNCYDIIVGSDDFMICKVYTDRSDEMDYIIKFYDEFGFFEPDQIKIEPSNKELYSKCEEVLSLAKSQDDLVYE